MSNNQIQLAALRALRDISTDPAQRAALDTAITALQGQPVPTISLGSGNQVGDMQMGDIAVGDVRKGIEGGIELSADARINGVAVGVNLGTIIYGRDPAEEERRHLARYLARLAAKLRRLPLSGLAARLDDGEGVSLEQVYVELAATKHVVFLEGYPQELLAYCLFEERTLSFGKDHAIPGWQVSIAESHSPDWVLPRDAVIDVYVSGQPRRLLLSRRCLATEAIYQGSKLLLVGDPGSGKSTFVRHLAWALARRGLDQIDNRTQLFGWADDVRLLPVLLPLRRLSGQISSEGTAATVVTATLIREMEREYGARDAADLLDRALVTGSALLLFDGLDEVPVEETPTSASRLATLHSLRMFVDLYPDAKIVITCRSRALNVGLRTRLGWDVEMIAPFTLGQIRHFVQVWFAMLQIRGSLDQKKANQYAQALIEAIVNSERLRRMAETPLLLTMMALVLVERGELPRDRPLLYEEVLRQLLGEWDVQKGGQSLAEVLGAPNLRGDDLRHILDQLSFIAHASATSEDGRGRLPARDLRLTLTEYLEKIRVPGAWEAAGRCLTYFSERSGLLLPEDDGGSYAFAHLTLQEHGAGRHLLLQPNAVQTVMERRADDRWREPISLGLGVAQRLYPMLADRIDRIFAELIDPDEGGRTKERVRWYHDLILAAELGKERDWDLLRALINVDRLQRDLKKGLVTLLADKAQALPVAKRVHAGFLLGDLGDPRYPVTVEQWRSELSRAGEPGSYFCRVEAGEYLIGSTDDDPDAKDNEKPLHTITIDQPFLIGRYVVTNDQWRAWVVEHGAASSYENDGNFNTPNQPVVGVSWEMTNDFCVWLSNLLSVNVRLPSEYEWEAAARGGNTRRYPWGDEWQEDHAASDENKGTHGWLSTVPVGCFPAGAGPCGALDMAGNVWEWTGNSWRSYPSAKKPFTEDDRRVQRGGSYEQVSISIRCGVRTRNLFYYWDGSIGFRIVVAPPLAHG